MIRRPAHVPAGRALRERDAGADAARSALGEAREERLATGRAPDPADVLYAVLAALAGDVSPYRLAGAADELAAAAAAVSAPADGRRTPPPGPPG